VLGLKLSTTIKMEAQVDRLVKKAWARHQQTHGDERFLIGISGIPGSGKTTLAALVTKRLNALASHSIPNSPPIAAFVPMDGYHLTRAQLDALPDPSEAHRRRGAAFTFDGPSFLALVKHIRRPVTPSTVAILAPSFDHAKKDPVENDIEILPSARIVVFEGNYLALNQQPWKEAGELMDEIWFVEVGEDVARERLAKRHVKAGICATVDEGRERASGSDLVNGREIMAGRWRVDEVVKSVEDGSWGQQE